MNHSDTRSMKGSLNRAAFMNTVCRMLIKLDECLVKSEAIVLIILVAVLTVIIFLQVIFRYFLVMPLYWSEELSRYLFVWLSILGATIALQKRGHFGVDIFFLMLPEKGRHFMKLLSVLLVGALALVILIHGISLVEKTSTQYSPAMEIPMNWAYASLPVGAALMLIHTAVIVLKEGSRTKSTE